MELGLSAHMLFLPPFFLFMNIKCRTLRLGLPFFMLLCRSHELRYFCTRCHHLLAILFLLVFVGGGGFSGLMVGQGRGKPARAVVCGALFGWSGLVSLGLGRGASNVSLGFVIFPTSAFYSDGYSFSLATAVIYSFPSSIWKGSLVTDSWSRKGNPLIYL